MNKNSTKFTKALEGLLSMPSKEALSLTSKEVQNKYNCASTCANYVIQAVKYFFSNKSN